MKIGIRPDTFRRWGDDRFQKAREHGYSCGHYGMVNPNTPVYQCTEEEFQTMILREKGLIQAAGIEITQVHGPFRMPPRDLDPGDRAEWMDKMKRSIRATSLLECKHWVVHPLMPYGKEDLASGHGEETWALNLEFMRELVKYAREYDVIVCLENMPYTGFSMASPEKVYAFVKEINNPYFKMCLDTGHANIQPGVNPVEVVKKCGDEIRVLHIHDNNGCTDQHLMPYLGNIDWKAFYKALLEVGYEGDFSLETEPSDRLSDEIYEDMCRIMMKIVKDIMED